ncbi:MAG: AsmA family protein [Proteobacteria bacterium]|nr:AsmA family protein [Pseudomonadota bacterium]
MKKIYVSFLIFISLIFLLLLLILGASNFINWGDHKNIVESVFTKYLGVDTKINGNLEISIFPNFRVYAENVEIKSFSGDANLLEMQHLLIYKNLKDLVLLDASIDELIINRPKLNLEIAKDGNPNWEPLKIRNNSYYSRQMQSFAKRITNFKKINIENGLVSYKNSLINENYDVSNIYLDFLNVESKISADYKFTIKEDYELLTKLDLKDLSNIRSVANLNSDSLKFGIHGVLTNYSDLSKLTFFGKSELSVRDITKLKHAEGVVFETLRKYVNLDDLVAKSDFTYSKNSLSVPKFEIKTAENELSGNLSWRFNKRDGNSVSTELNAKQIKIRENKSLEKYFDMDNLAESTLDFSFIKDLNIGAALICESCSYGDKTLRDINLRANLANNSLIVNQLSFKASEEGIEGRTGSLNMTAIVGFNNPIGFESKQEFNNFPLYTILPKSTKDRIKFNVDGKLNLSSSGNTIKTMSSNLSGNMDMYLRNVELQNIDASNLKAMTKNFLQGNNDAHYNTPVSDLKLEGVIRDGVLRHSDIMFNIYNAGYETKGKFDLANLTLNYRVAPLYISKESLGEVVRGKVTAPEIIQDKVTPRGVIDGYGRLVTKEVIEKSDRKIETHFDYNDKANMRENVMKYLFDKKSDN